MFTYAQGVVVSSSATRVNGRLITAFMMEPDKPAIPGQWLVRAIYTDVVVYTVCKVKLNKGHLCIKDAHFLMH